MSKISRKLLLVAIAPLLLWSSPPVPAQARYPERMVRLVVPFSPGGSIDVLARTIGHKLSQEWSIPAMVENRPGASGNIGTDFVAKAAPDGYTLLVTASTVTITPSLMRNVGFDPVRSFTPVAKLAVGDLALVTRPGFAARSTKELVALGKAAPGSITYGSPGSGTPHHLAMELFKQQAGFDALHVPYRGSGNLVSDVLSGQVDMAFVPINQALPHIRAGKLQLLAAGGSKRTSVTPDTPSLEEASGVKGVDCELWFGVYAPAGTSPEIVNRLNADIQKALEQPDVQQVLTVQGLSPTPGSPADLARLTSSEQARWAAVIRKGNIRAD